MFPESKLAEFSLLLKCFPPSGQWHSETPIYRGVWGKENIRGKSGSAVNRGFVLFTLCMFSPIWGEGNGRGISGFYCTDLLTVSTTLVCNSVSSH